MSRYPHLPEALHQLLEAGSWTGTPTELYAALEPYRQEPWPSNPVALSLWLRNRAERFGIAAEHHHTGEHRLLRLARRPNGLEPSAQARPSETYRFSLWAELEQALPELVQSAELVTLVVVVRPDFRLGKTIEARYLPLAAREWAAQFPSPLALWLVRGCVSLAEWSPSDNSPKKY